MNEKQQKLCRQLDRAIDAGELAEVDRILAQLDSLAAKTIEAEDQALFAARIKGMGKEHLSMNKKSMRTVLIAAALVVVVSLGVYAASNWRSFQVTQGDRLVRITTNDSLMTQEQAKQLAQEEVTGTGRPQEGNAITLEPVLYQSIEEAQAALGLEVALPEKLPELPLKSVRGMELNDHDKIIWINYEDGEKLFGVTISWCVPDPNTTTTIIEVDDVDEGSMGSYQAKGGQRFDTLTDTNQDGTKTANIAFAKVGWTEYALVFVGFDEGEIHQILDTVNLSAYQ